jgi:hypothetical protein
LRRSKGEHPGHWYRGLAQPADLRVLPVPGRDTRRRLHGGWARCADLVGPGNHGDGVDGARPTGIVITECLEDANIGTV